MKPLKIILILAAVVLTASIIFFTSPSAQNKITDGESTTVGYRYTVKSYNGKIAVFEYMHTQPIEILDCPISSLPAKEAEKLNKGIDITNEFELQSIIEAFD